METEHKLVKMSISPKQISKLRNGHKVRVKPDIKGNGVGVLVNPRNYSLLTKTFSRNKGMELVLSPQELVVNQEASAQMQGNGIFGKRFDKGVEKLLGKKAKKQIYSSAETLLPLAQAGLTAGLTSAGTALGVAQPELIPFIAPGVATLSALGSDYLANPSKYQSNIGGSKAKLAKDLATRELQNQALSRLNAELGTNMGALDKASLVNALSDKARAELTARTIDERKLNEMTDYQKLLAGSGLYAAPQGRGMMLVKPHSRTAGIVGVGGGIVKTPQALASQPFAQNYQFQRTLPPAYQKYSSGSGLFL